MTDRSNETPLERRARYLKLAREAKELAGRSKSMQMREACLGMAQSWLSLASDVSGADGGEAADSGAGRPAPRLDPAEAQVALAAPAPNAGPEGGDTGSGRPDSDGTGTWNGASLEADGDADGEALSCEPSRRED